MSAKPRVVLLRGHHANVWDLRPWELLRADFDMSVLVTGSNVHQVEGLELDRVPVSTPRDVLPAGRAAGAVAYVLGERYLGLEERLRGASIVHAAELSTWFAAQAARLRARLGYSLVLTAWETIPWGAAYRWPRERRYRKLVLEQADLFLATTERSRRALLLEGVAPERIELCPPGVEIERFRGARAPAPARHLVVSAGRLVWEKGHQDFLRALAAIRRGLAGPPRDDVAGLVVGSGPEEKRLRRHAAELGLADAVEFRATLPNEEMPAIYGEASALVLASLPTRGWEEQFGMVLVEAMAAGTPVVAAASGAIPEVLGGQGELFEAGDWLHLAQRLVEGPLSRPPAQRTAYEPAALERYSTAAAADRYRAVYRRLLG
jgi:glycosyltransferase involved in cell wall biosynthesis